MLDQFWLSEVSYTSALSLRLVIVSLATWRISSMLTAEQGPFNMFVKLRNKLGFAHDEFGLVIGRPTGNVLSCLWCTSIYISIALMLLPVIISLPFAISALSIIIHEKLVS